MSEFNEHGLGIQLAIVIVSERLRQCRGELAYEEGKWGDLTLAQVFAARTRKHVLEGSISELEDLLKRFNNLLRTQDDK